MAFFGGGMCRVVSRPQAAQKEKACHAASLFDRDTDRWHTQKKREKNRAPYIYIKISKTHAQSDKCCVYIVHIDVIRQKIKNKKGE